MVNVKEAIYSIHCNANMDNSNSGIGFASVSKPDPRKLEKLMQNRIQWIHRLVWAQVGILVVIIVCFIVLGALYSHPIKSQVNIIEDAIKDLPSIQKQVDELLPEAHATLHNVQAQIATLVHQVQQTLTQMNMLVPQVQQKLTQVQQTNTALCSAGFCGSN